MNPIKNPFRVNAALVLTLCSPSVFSSDADEMNGMGKMISTLGTSLVLMLRVF